MSGTSTDGITAAAVRFAPTGADGVTAELLGWTSRPFAPAERERLLRAIEGAAPADYAALDFDMGGWIADAALAALAAAGLEPADVRAIASHGHTLWHEPPRGSWQIGVPAVLAERTGIGVVSGFRTRDVAAGGQGAPLVPIADAMLFAGPGWRALQNLGGIGNVTVVPPAGESGRVLAFDTGPGVAIIDGVTRALAPPLPFDVDGALARRGTPIASVVASALTLPYFSLHPPKSTGRELFSRAYITEFIDACRRAEPNVTTHDIVATAVALTAASIADAYRRFVDARASDVVVSGGGARHPVLMETLAHQLAPRRLRRFEELFFDGDAKEAVAFALLGWLHLQGRPGNVPSATGARGPRLLGSWTPP
jgi:anhydro-N-acetylmuramic acid kinase